MNKKQQFQFTKKNLKREQQTALQTKAKISIPYSVKERDPN
jgi:hypothetical protein